MYLFRGDAPLQEFGATLPAPVRLGFRFIGHRFLRTYPYEEAFFLPYARQFQRALSMPLILLGGITELATIETALAEGFAFVAMARALLREPDLPEPHAGGRLDRVAVHPLQQVHAHHLLGHPLRPGDRFSIRGRPPGLRHVLQPRQHPLLGRCDGLVRVVTDGVAHGRRRPSASTGVWQRWRP